MCANGEWMKEPSNQGEECVRCEQMIVSDSPSAWEGKNEMEKKKRRRGGIGGGQQLWINN